MLGTQNKLTVKQINIKNIKQRCLKLWWGGESCLTSGQEAPNKKILKTPKQNLKSKILSTVFLLKWWINRGMNTISTNLILACSCAGFILPPLEGRAWSKTPRPIYIQMFKYNSRLSVSKLGWTKGKYHYGLWACIRLQIKTASPWPQALATLKQKKKMAHFPSKANISISVRMRGYAIYPPCCPDSNWDDMVTIHFLKMWERAQNESASIVSSWTQKTKHTKQLEPQQF